MLVEQTVLDFELTMEPKYQCLIIEVWSISGEPINEGFSVKWNTQSSSHSERAWYLFTFCWGHSDQPCRTVKSFTITPGRRISRVHVNFFQLLTWTEILPVYGSAGVLPVPEDEVHAVPGPGPGGDVAGQLGLAALHCGHQVGRTGEAGLGSGAPHYGQANVIH